MSAVLNEVKIHHDFNSCELVATWVIIPCAWLGWRHTPEIVIVQSLVTELKNSILILHLRQLDFSMHEVGLFLVKLDVFENRVVAQSVVPELKLIECYTVHQ